MYVKWVLEVISCVSWHDFLLPAVRAILRGEWGCRQSSLCGLLQFVQEEKDSKLVANKFNITGTRLIFIKECVLIYVLGLQ